MEREEEGVEEEGAMRGVDQPKKEKRKATGNASRPVKESMEGRTQCDRQQQSPLFLPRVSILPWPAACPLLPSSHSPLPHSPPPHFASSNMSNPSSRQPISNAAGIETRRSIDNELVQEAVGKGNSTVHGKNPLAPNGPFDTHPVSLSFFEDCKSVSGSVTHI